MPSLFAPTEIQSGECCTARRRTAKNNNGLAEKNNLFTYLRSDSYEEITSVECVVRINDCIVRTPPFFILGAPRSGTSLLSRMLNEHDQIAVPFETKIIENFHNKEQIYGTLNEVTNQRRVVVDMLNIPTMRDVHPRINVDQVMPSICGDRLADMFDAVLAAWAQQQGKNRWGEKSVSNALYFRTIIQWFPNAKFIHPIRDGRDVTASLQKAPFGPKTPYTAARRWRQFVELGLQIGDSLPAEQYMSLHYEDLLDHPERELKRICDFLGEEYRESMLRFSENTNPYPTDPVNDSNLKMGLLVSNKLKWRRSMAPKEIAIIEAVVGRTLSKCGYERTVDNRTIGTLETLYRKYIEPIPNKSVSIIRNRRGYAEALAKLKLALRRRWGRLANS